MRVLVITKRQYMNRDLLDDRFGRYREIPLALAELGHEVRGLCLSYEKRSSARVLDESDAGATVQWRSLDLGKTRVVGLILFIRLLRQVVAEFRPDVIWAGSDAIYGHLARAVGKGTAIVFDFYDDYETFKLARLPGAVRLNRTMVRAVDGVTSFSQEMTDRVGRRMGRKGPTVTLLTGVDKTVFAPSPKIEARMALGLPGNNPIVGMAGAISGRVGVEAMWSAAELLREVGVHFAIAGSRDADQTIPGHPRVHDFGLIDHDAVPTFLNALDVGIALVREGDAGRVGFPHKAFEMIAVGLPMVAVDSGAMRSVLAEFPQALFDAEDGGDLARAIRYQLAERKQPSQPIPDWGDVARFLEEFLISLPARVGR